MSVFCDSSALVKRYADEAGADVVRALEGVVVSVLARVEVPAALWRKHRIGELGLDDTSLLVEAFERDWYGAAGPFASVGLTQQIVESAARCVARHPLLAYGAVQLATALVAREADTQLATFCCCDATLLAAAQAEGFRPVRLPPN